MTVVFGAHLMEGETAGAAEAAEAVSLLPSSLCWGYSDIALNSY